MKHLACRVEKEREAQFLIPRPTIQLLELYRNLSLIPTSNVFCLTSGSSRLLNFSLSNQVDFAKLQR